MDRGIMLKSGILVIAVFAVVVVVGSLASSAPSEATRESAQSPTTTTTTEPPPPGEVVVRLSNGSFRPSNLALDLTETQIVHWINEDPREYLLADLDGAFESPLPPGGEFRFDYSALEPSIYRYYAEIGFQRIPGSVDTRPEQ